MEEQETTAPPAGQECLRRSRGSAIFLPVLVFARELFVCVCPTAVPRENPEAGELASRVRFLQGTEADLGRVDPEHHDEEAVADLRARLDRGEHWLIGEIDDRIVTYTWLKRDDRAVYPSLPGCEVHLRDDTGYGYDAWTPPELRGQGLRRVAFLEELHVLREWGLEWEASFFVKHQLEGAQRSLGSVGIDVIPLYRVQLMRDRSLVAERLRDDDLAGAAVPTFYDAPGDHA